MRKYNSPTGVSLLWAVALLASGCSDVLTPPQRGATPGAATPAFATSSLSGIALDQQNGVLNDGVPWGSGGTHVGKGFDPTNPHLGDAIVATFVWRGTTNTITTVTDHLSDAAQTPVGNTYTLVDYVTAGGYSMATYVATNVQNFPDPNTSPDQVLAVHAIFSDTISEGGVMLSAWTGVSGVSAEALGAYLSGSGMGSSTTTADPGAIPLGAGALAYGITLSNGVVGIDRPPGFTNISTGSDPAIEVDGEYLVTDSALTVEPQWTWYFNAPSTWLATVLALNPAATHAAFVVQPSNTLLPGTAIRPPVQVAALDAQGNPVTSFTGPVTIALAHDGSLLGNAHLTGTTTVAAVNGVATFADLSVDQIGWGYTLQAAAANLPAIVSAPFNVGVP
jgi:hypothetical protein